MFADLHDSYVLQLILTALLKYMFFLGFNSLCLVETCISEFRKAGGGQPNSIPHISIDDITNRLIEILMETYDDIDILCLVVSLIRSFHV